MAGVTRRNRRWCIALLLVLWAVLVTLRPTKEQRGHVGQPVPPQAAAQAVPRSSAATSLASSAVRAYGEGEARFETLLVTPEETRLRFTAGGYRLWEEEVLGGRRSRLEMSGAWNSEEAGKPSLPRCRVDVALPHGRGTQVELLHAEWEEIACAPPVASAGLRFCHDVPEPVVEAAEVYQGGETWPRESLVRLRPYSIRRVGGMGLVLMAARYDFSRGVLQVCRRAELRVTSPGAQARDYGQLCDEWDFRQLQTRAVCNGALLRGGETSTVPGSLLVIAPEAWTSHLSVFCQWKRRLGYAVEVLGYPEEGDAAWVRSAIAERYASGRLTHVLLVGRATDVPPAIYQQSDDPGTRLMCSDVPYALLAGDDVYQDIFLGRLPASSPTELVRVLGQLQRYEAMTWSQEPGVADAWLASAVFVASEQGYNDGNVWTTDHKVSSAEASRLTGVFSSRQQLYEKDATAQQVTEAINAGCSWLQYLGHGHNDSWVTSGFGVDDVGNLENDLSRPLVGSYACLTANFGASAPSLGEVMVLGERGGACGFLGATNETPLLPPVKMMRALNDAILRADGAERLLVHGAYAAEAIGAGVRYCETITPPKHAELVAKQFHLLGEPTLGARFRRLQALNVTAEIHGATLKLQLLRPNGLAWPAGASLVMAAADGTPLHAVRLERGGSVSVALPEHARGRRLRVLISDPLHGQQEVEVIPNWVTLEEKAKTEAMSLLKNLEKSKSETIWRYLLASWREGGAAEPVVQPLPETVWPDALATPSASPEAFDCRSNPFGQDGSGAGHLSVEEVERRLEAQWLRHGEACRPEWLGESVEGRRIAGIRLGRPVSETGEALPEFLVVAGAHGDETGGMEVALRLAETLLEQRHEELLQRCCLYVVPCVNPDGLAAGTRLNQLGADVERAFPSGMQEFWASGMPLELGVGEQGERCPEVSALMRWCASRRVAAALVLHSGGERVIYPPVTRADDAALLRELAQTYALHSNMAVAEDEIAGEASSWLWRALGVLPLTVEVAALRRPAAAELPAIFSRHREALYQWLEGCLARTRSGRICDDQGQPLVGARLTAPSGATCFADQAGQFARMWLGSDEILTISAPGWQTAEMTPAQGQLQLERADEVAVVLTGSPWRHLPGRECQLELAVSSEGVYGLNVRLPEGWRLSSAGPSGTKLKAWRYEGDGTVTLIADGAGRLTLGAIPPAAPAGEHLWVVRPVTARGEGTAAWWHWLSAEPVRQQLMAETASLASLWCHPQATSGQMTAWTWERQKFVLSDVGAFPAGRGFWHTGEEHVVRGWLPHERTLSLKAGWNLVGVPWRCPASKLGGSVFGVAGKVLCPVEELLPGNGYWLYSPEHREVKY